jgi:large subunit ribosomal protein L10
MKRSEKEQKVENYGEALETASFAILTEFGKTSVVKVEKLRQQLAEINCSAMVMKNTLARIVFERQGIEEITEHLVGPTMMFYGGDEIAPAAKLVQKLGKEHSAFKVKAILFDGKIYRKDEFSTFTSMPTMHELRGKFVGILMAPATQFVRVINTPQRIASLIKAYADKRGD